MPSKIMDRRGWTVVAACPFFDLQARLQSWNSGRSFCWWRRFAMFKGLATLIYMRNIMLIFRERKETEKV